MQKIGGMSLALRLKFLIDMTKNFYATALHWILELFFSVLLNRMRNEENFLYDEYEKIGEYEKVGE